jgi:putative ABC transport system permease protein
VVGIFERTLVSWDNFVFISFPEAQELYQETLPSIFQDLPIEVVGSFEVLPESGVDMNELAGRIEAQVKGIKTFPPEKLMGQAKQAQALFNAFLLGSGVIALIVGGLAVINTMTMSVHERVREIGLKKAVGASSTQILGEYLLEAAFIGLVGGVLGILLGSLTASAINSVTQAQGVTVFTMSPRLLIGSVAFAVGLAVVASFYPAYLAARLNPVQALRME